MSPPFEGFYLKSRGAKVYEETMRTYPEELKAKIIARLLPPNNESVPDVAKQTGIPKDTLYAWRIKHRRGNHLVESGQAGTKRNTSSPDSHRWLLFRQRHLLKMMRLSRKYWRILDYGKFASMTRPDPMIRIFPPLTLN
jgi:transposase-like protein